MGGIAQLGYVGFEVSDPKQWEKFANDILGLQTGATDGDYITYLRMDERDQRVILTKGPADDLTFVGWELPSDNDLIDFVAKVQADGIAVTKAPGELAKLRKVESLYTATDPNGIVQEFYYGASVSQNPFISPTNASTFVTGEQGMGHILICAKDRAETDDFYRRILGLRLSDYIRQEIAPGVVVDATFLHVNGRHHTLAFAQIPAPKHIHHIMVQVEDMSDVGRAYDRCLDTKTPIVMSLGHHPNDEMFSFYVQSPANFAVEVGWGGLIVPKEGWTVKNFSRLSDWGHRPLA